MNLSSADCKIHADQGMVATERPRQFRSHDFASQWLCHGDPAPDPPTCARYPPTNAPVRVRSVRIIAPRKERAGPDRQRRTET